MRVFISWSGEPSRSVAQALRDWLPMVVQHVEPWMSDEDIESGGRWNDQIAAELDRAEYGIICLTSTNLERPWLLFEAGALAKRFDVARVVPLLIDLRPADVTMPLGSFQSRPLSEDGMLRLVRDMNGVREQPLPPQQIEQLFAGMWPTLEARVQTAKAVSLPEEHGSASRRPEDVMAELVETVRRIERRMDSSSLEASKSLFNDRPFVSFAEDLEDAAAQLAMYEEALTEGLVDRSELASIATRFRGIVVHAGEIGLPVQPPYFRKALEKWHRHYDKDHVSQN
jgi:hypothetical protein